MLYKIIEQKIRLIIAHVKVAIAAPKFPIKGISIKFKIIFVIKAIKLIKTVFLSNPNWILATTTGATELNAKPESKKQMIKLFESV